MGSSKHKGHIPNIQEIIQQYLRFNLNENHDDDESDCINADDINDDDSSIDVKILITLITTLFIIKMQ